MRSPKLTEEEEAELAEELSEALEEMMDRTCEEMGPLWWSATRADRVHLGEHAIPDLGFEPSARYLALSKGARSKYRALAAWRHAVLWRDAAREIDPDFRDAMQVVYFTPYPANEPPYAWSSSAAGAPGLERFPNRQSLKDQAKEGCYATLLALRAEAKALETGAGFASELRAMLLEPATGRSLRDVLKLEEHLEEYK